MTTITVWRTPESPAVFVNAVGATPGHLAAVAHTLRLLADMVLAGDGLDETEAMPGVPISREPNVVIAGGQAIPELSQVLVITFTDAGDLSGLSIPDKVPSLTTLLDAAGFMAAQAGFHYTTVVQAQAQQQMADAALLRELASGRGLLRQ